MTASSVTGLFNNGVGSVDGKNMGSDRMTLGSDHLIGVRVVAAGSVTLVSNAATVKFPQPLPGSADGYVVMLTPIAASGASHEVSCVSKTTASSNFTQFAIAGVGATDVVMWMVVKNG